MPRLTLSTVGARIALLTGLLMAMSVALTATSLTMLVAVRGDIRDLRDEAMRPVETVDRVTSDLLAERIAILSHASSVDARTKATYAQKLAAAREVTDADLAEFRGLADGRERSEVAEIEQLVASYRDLIDTEYLPASDAGDLARVQELRDTKAAPQMAAIVEDLTALATEQQDHADALVEQASASVTRAFVEMAVFLGVSVALGVALATRLTRSVRRPLVTISGVVAALADGDLTQRAGIARADELGRMSQGLDHALDSVHGTLVGVSGHVRSLTDGAGRLDDTSEVLTASAATTADRATMVAASATQVSSSIGTLAAAAEEMSASIREISRNVSAASTIAAEAVATAGGAHDTVARLEGSSRQISDVVKLINSIAEQTNLLALNATIEAARAGDVGKGFAVVAGEVKELAQQTATATDDIARRVHAIQEDSTSAMDALGGVVSVIGEINGYQATIAAAVEQQSMTTNEMSRSIAESAGGADGIATAVEEVAAEAAATAAAASTTHTVAQDMRALSDEFTDLVQRFTLTR